MHFHASNIHLPTGQNQEQRPSRLSTRSIQSKFYDPLISVQGQNQEQRPSRLSTRSPQSKIYDPLVSVQGQNEKKNDPLVSVQGHFNPKFMTLSSQYKVKMKKK